MKKKNRRLMLSLGSVMSISLVSVGIVSCATNPNNGITPSGKDAYTIYFKDGTSKSVTYDQFMEYLRNHEGTNTTQQVQYDNQVIKWLYKDEQAASVTAHEKDSTVPALTSYDDVYDNANKKLEDAKKAIKTQYGTDWEPEWAKALLSSQYGGALSEAEAKEYLAVQTMKADALKRFTLKIDTSTYTKDNMEDGQHSFLTGPNKTTGASQIENGHATNTILDRNSKNAIALISSSYDDSYKAPDQLLQAYMSKYKTAYNTRHILYALKAGATPKDPWTLSTDSIKKLYGILPGQPQADGTVYKQLKSLGTSTYADGVKNWAADPKLSYSENSGSLVGQIVANYSDNGAAAKTFGSLGMSSLYDNVKNQVPGFAIPIAVSNYDPTPPVTKIAIDPTPLLSTATLGSNSFDMDAALKASDDDIWKTTDPSADPNIQQDITNVLGDANKLTKVLKNLKTQFTKDASGARSWEYEFENTSIPDEDQRTHAVLSSDGLHMIYQENIQEQTDLTKDPTGGLMDWMFNDLVNTKISQGLVYNIIKEVNAKIAPTDNFSNIYSLVENYPKPSYSEAETFNQFVKTQKNYANDNNSNFTEEDIKQAKSIANILETTKKEDDILTVQKKYRDWWNKTIITDKLINNKNSADKDIISWKYINTMIANLGEAN